MKVEWAYLLVLITAIIVGIHAYFTRSVTISWVHVVFLLAGGLLTELIFILTGTEITSLKASNFLLQTAIGNFLLGFPLLFGTKPIKTIELKPTEMLVAVASEEVFRIGSAVWLINTINKEVGFLMSAIIFGAMHIYWHPQQWFFAIFGGAVLSGLLIMYESQTASVSTHFMYNLAILGMISPLIFFALSAIMGIIGYALMKGEK